MSPVAALIILIIIVNIFKSLSKAAKQNRGNGSAEAPEKPVQRMPARTASPKPAVHRPPEPPKRVQPSDAEVIDQIARADSVQKVVDVLKLAAEKSAGGSMNAESTEGESREEHARHELRRAASIAAETKPTAPRRIDVSDLRRAVVMSEILDKPKALRR